MDQNTPSEPSQQDGLWPPDWPASDRELLAHGTDVPEALREQEHAELMQRTEWWTSEALRILHSSKFDRDARASRALSHALILGVRAAELRDPSDPMKRRAREAAVTQLPQRR